MHEWKDAKSTGQRPRQTTSDNRRNTLRLFWYFKRILEHEKTRRTSNGFTNCILRSTLRLDQRPCLNIGPIIHLQSQKYVFSRRKEPTNDPSRQCTRKVSKRSRRILQGKPYFCCTFACTHTPEINVMAESIVLEYLSHARFLILATTIPAELW